MTQLFKKKAACDLRDITLKVRVNIVEHEKIKTAAKIRFMDVAEYLRRTALGRKANVDYETETVLALMDLARAVRELHKGLVEQGLPLMEEELHPIILGVKDALLRISK